MKDAWDALLSVILALLAHNFINTEEDFPAVKKAVEEFIAKGGGGDLVKVLRRIGEWATDLSTPPAWNEKTLEILAKFRFHLVFTNMVSEGGPKSMAFGAIAGLVSSAI